MPDKKLTEGEIIKALDNIQNHKWIFAKADNGDFIRIGDVADLINRQKAEVSELQHRNSELEIELKSMRGAANSYKAEVERLKDTLNATIAGQETFQRYIATAKAEAVKEFAERLKKQSILCAGCVPWYDIQETIDNLVEL